MNGLENLANMEYPGRFIAIGLDKTGLNNVIVYGVTGRSSSSQAREIVINKELEEKEEFALKTNPTDQEALEKGNKALLIYNCIRAAGPMGERAFIVSNGAQTDIIHNTYEGISRTHVPFPLETLAKAFARPDERIYGSEFIDITKYEPDHPNFTPRISGIINSEGAALHIVKNTGSFRDQQLFEVLLLPGRGKLIATYTGENKDPLPSFEGVPLDVELDGSPIDLAESFYQALGPSEAGKGMLSPGKDFRVAVAAVMYPRDDDSIGYDAFSHHIINRHERGE